MHTLVTGGAGFIGSHSVDALLADGATVTVLDNFAAGRRANLPASHAALRIIEGDIRDFATVARAMSGATHVLHLAAQISVQVSIAKPVDSCQDNVLGFLNVLDCARKNEVKRMVYASSAAVYGTPTELPLDEDSPVAPISPYGLEKSIDDQYARLFRDLYGFSAIGMRYFNVYGPRQDPSSQYAGVISKFAAAIASGSPLRIFGDGGQTRDFVFVKDVARMNLRALTADSPQAHGFCNIGTGRSVTLLELVDALERCAGKRAQRKFEPPAAGDIRESSMSPQRQQLWFADKPATSLDVGLAALLAETQPAG
jgi:UDP-glucose 4-epimerase